MTSRPADFPADDRVSPAGYRVRPARPGDEALLPEIERRAAARFADVALLALLAEGEPTPESVFAEACLDGRLWVAEKLVEEEPIQVHGEIVGFALARELEGSLHLQEMDVVPEHGRRGLGRRLVLAVLDAARRRGHRRVTLTTFRHIAWNGPFYARLGFEEIAPADFSPEIRDLVAGELEAGLVPELRCVMSLRL